MNLEFWVEVTNLVVTSMQFSTAIFKYTNLVFCSANLLLSPSNVFFILDNMSIWYFFYLPCLSLSYSCFSLSSWTWEYTYNSCFNILVYYSIICIISGSVPIDWFFLYSHYVLYFLAFLHVCSFSLAKQEFYASRSRFLLNIFGFCFRA